MELKVERSDVLSLIFRIICCNVIVFERENKDLNSGYFTVGVIQISIKGLTKKWLYLIYQIVNILAQFSYRNKILKLRKNLTL